MSLPKLPLFSLLFLFLCSCSTIDISENKNAEIWSGRFSVTTQFPKHSDRHSGSFRLNVLRDKKELFIFGPLGAQVAEIEEVEGRCSLIESNRETRTAENCPELLNSVIGVPLDLVTFLSWLEEGSTESKQVTDGWEIFRAGPPDARRLTAKGKVPQSSGQITLIILPKRDR